MRTLLLILFLALPAAGYAQSFVEQVGAFQASGTGGIQFGATIADVNRDGLADIYQPGRLYYQRQDGRFQDIIFSGTRFDDVDGEVVFGGIFGDVDGDGFPDLYIEDLIEGSRFFSNRYGVRWAVRRESGIDLSEAQSQGAVWADFDADGNLDLFVGEELGKNMLFLGDGSGGFTRREDPDFIQIPHSYGVAGRDYDNDGDIDLFIAACHPRDAALSVNLLFRNDGGGEFTDVSAEAGIDDDLSGWGVVWLDYDRDGWDDVFIANQGLQFGADRSGMDRLYRNLGDGTFVDVALDAGVAGLEDESAFGASAADFDNDGWVDVYVANDFVVDRLYRNNGDGTFTDLMPTLAISDAEDGISVSTGDVNGDGWIDVFKGGGFRSKNTLYFGQPVDGNHWMRFRLQSAQPGNRDALGARLTVWAGGERYRNQILAGDGMTSQNDGAYAHFGLGAAAEVDSARVDWPDGTSEVQYDLSGDRVTYWVQSAGLNRPPPSPRLRGPVNGSVVSSTAEPIRFEWDPVEDPDGDPITYTLAVLGQGDVNIGTGVEFVFEGLAETTMELEPALMVPDRYEWVVIASDGHWRQSSGQERIVTVGSLTGVEAPSAPHALTIHPNPASQAMTVSGSGPWEIFDVMGRRVQSGEHSGTARLDVAPLAPGLYLIRRGPDSGVFVRR